MHEDLLQDQREKDEFLQYMDFKINEYFRRLPQIEKTPKLPTPSMNMYDYINACTRMAIPEETLRQFYYDSYFNMLTHSYQANNEINSWLLNWLIRNQNAQ